MRFLVDACTGPAVASWLQSLGHDVYSVYEKDGGMSDDDILLKANAENWILVTNDKDFGEMVFREKRPHRGVVFVRLQNERSQVKITVLEQLLLAYEHQLADAFVVVTETQVRFAQG